jgi:hypothetical protein
MCMWLRAVNVDWMVGFTQPRPEYTGFFELHHPIYN